MGKIQDLAEKPRVVVDTCVLLRAMYHTVYPELDCIENRQSFNALALARNNYALCFTADTSEEAVYMISTIRRGIAHDTPTRAMQRLQFVNRYIDPAMLIVQPGYTNLVCRDPKDQMFLEAAAGCGADYIVSTDNDILVLQHDGLCAFVPPEQFCNKAKRVVAAQRQQQRAISAAPVLEVV